MKTWFIFLVGALTFFAIVVALYDHLKNRSFHALSSRKSEIAEAFYEEEKGSHYETSKENERNVGLKANGIYILQKVDLITNQFAYKVFVTDSGCLRTQVDFLVLKATPTNGGIAQFTGEVTVNNSTPTYAPFVAGANYSNGTFNNVTLVNVSGSMKGSGGMATVTVAGGAVTRVSISNGGIGYAKDDILKPCFTFADSSGNQTGCSPHTGAEARFKVATIKTSSLANPTLNDDVWPANTTVRDVGPGAEYAANESQNGQNLTYIGGSYSAYYPGKCEVGSVPNNAQNQWFCLMDEIAVKKDGQARNYLRFNTMTVLAKTSDHDDFHTYYLLLTYSGLGILTAPRGSIITVDLFATGYTDLFPELGHPRCGQTSSDLPLGGLPGLGLSDFNNYICGLGCAIFIPPTSTAAADYNILIWELASPNGLFRIQFFDSGHFRFVAVGATGPVLKLNIVSGGTRYSGPLTADLLKDPKYGSLGAGVGGKATVVVSAGVITAVTVTLGGSGYAIGDKLTLAGSNCTFEVIRSNNIVDPIIFETRDVGQDVDYKTSTNMYYPRCVEPKISVSLVPTKSILIRRDAWVIRGSTFNLDRDGTLVSIPSLDMMVQITDGGALVLEKDYKYGTDNQNNHTFVQSAIGRLLPEDPLTQIGPINDSRNKHWALGNALACYGGVGSNMGGTFDLANGTVLAQTNTFTDSNPNFGNGRYILWLGQYGLRLLYSSNVSATLLQDMTRCIWITPFYFNWWYIGGNSSNNLFTRSSVCRTSNFPNWPIPNVTNNGSSGGGNPKINTCGFFRKPSATTPDGEPEEPIVILSSKNKRFLFRMMNSGRCMLIDTKTPATPLFTTDNYTQVTSLAQCP
jgi:hypothetical protein